MVSDRSFDPSLPGPVRIVCHVQVIDLFNDHRYFERAIAPSGDLERRSKPGKRSAFNYFLRATGERVAVAIAGRSGLDDPRWVKRGDEYYAWDPFAPEDPNCAYCSTRARRPRPST